MFFIFGTKGVFAATYEETFTSQILDNDYLVQYGNASWNADTTSAGTSVVVKVRTDSSFDMSGATAWASCTAIVSGSDISTNNCVADGERYLQYQITLGTNNPNLTPTFYDINFQTNVSTLISSVFDSQDSRNTLQGFDWTESLNGGNVLFQIRTSPDGSSWTNWCGPDNAGAGCNRESFFTDFSGSETIDAIFQDNASDRYFQYKAILVSDSIGGNSLPEISRVNFDYDLPTTSIRTYQETYTSKSYTSSLTGYSQISWNDNILPNTSLSVKVRTDSNLDMSTAPLWSTCALVSNNVDISSNNCVDDGEQYIQYQVTLGTDNTNVTPTFYDMHIYTEDLANLISSPFNSTAPDNALGRVSWIEDSTLPNGAQVALSLRSASSLANLSSAVWTQVAVSNGSGITQGCSRENGTVDCDSSVIPAGMKDAVGDQYFQYKMELSASNGISPTVSQVQITYVVNGAPEVQAVSAVPNSSGNVDILYETKDPDTLSGTVTRGFVTPSFQYSLDGGTSWNNTTANCFLGAEDLVDKAVNQDTFTQYGATWDPSCEAGISTTKYETDAQIKVIVNDNEAANSTDEMASTNFTLDTKPPVISNLTLNASTSPAEIEIISTDDSTYQMKLAQGEDQQDCETNLTTTNYESYNSTPTITPNQDPSTICLQLQDQYGNTSTISHTDSPETPTAMMIQDTTNVQVTPNEFRLFAAWKISTDPDFSKYELYRSPDNENFTKIFETFTQSTNSYPDNTVVGDQLYYYKVKTIDSNNNQSYYSETVQAKANGIQDFGEGGGGESTAPPIIDNVQINNIYTSQATITWNTDIFSNSTVGYYAVPPATQCLTAPCSFTTEIGSDTMYDNQESGHYGPHTIVLSNLTPDTDYYFQVKSMGVNQITATNDNTTHLGYHFKTLPGPKIIQNSVTVSKTTNTSVTINWQTDTDASSSVTYSTSADMSDPANFQGTNQDSTNHEVVINNLTQGTKYYFFVESTHNDDTATDNNEYPLNSYYSFTTTQDLTPPTITFDPDTDISKTTTTAKINFTTSEQSTSTLEYGLDTDYGTELTSDNLNINQVFDLEDLTPNTTYHFKITATDENSNLNSNSNTDYTFTTNSVETPDETGPTISDVIVSGITYNSAVIRWVTDQVSNSLVDYGETNSYGKIQGGDFDNPVTVHEVLLNGLNSVTTYYYKVASYDADNNLSTQNKDDSNNLLTFTTPSPTSDSDSNGEGDQLSDIMSQIQDMIDNYYFTEAEIQDALSGLYSISITSSGPSVDIEDTTATFTWTTNRPAIGKIYYWQDTDNQDTATSQAENITIARTDHEIIIKNLNANTKYNYYAYSEGLLNSIAQSDNQSFSTGDTASLSGISISNLTLNSADISWTTTGSIDSSTLEYGESIKYGNENKGKTSNNLHTVKLMSKQTPE
ncbi:MAG: Fibronectin type III domain protein [Candidatus Moranbacteria bacterium GW2011_GWF1_36_78]|nr:MAG: Fibronectin type III domain protein [Candidatus Moranbacteria bacterium GW2011_GWF1_36_78]